VIQRDPAYAPAYAGLSMTAHLAPIYGYVSYDVGYDEAVRAAERAIALDSTLAEPWATLGLVRQRRYDWAGAIVAYREALRRDANAAVAHQWYGKALTQLGRYDEAEAEVRRALALDPTSAVIRYNLGQLHFAARRHDAAAPALQAALAVAPSFRFAHTTLGFVRVAQGRFADAIDEFSAAATDPSHTPDETAVLAYGYAMAGQRPRARALLAEALQARSRDRRVSATDLAVAYMALGARDAAFTWLGRAYDEHDSDLAAFATSPVLDPLRGDPRFAALRARMRLPAEPARDPAAGEPAAVVRPAHTLAPRGERVHHARPCRPPCPPPSRAPRRCCSPRPARCSSSARWRAAPRSGSPCRRRSSSSWSACSPAARASAGSRSRTTASPGGSARRRSRSSCSTAG
jgi:tetratricopeptide (TPR) repeat protein